MKNFIWLICIFGIGIVCSQKRVYTVDLEVRNNLIPLVNKAKSLIVKNEFEEAIGILVMVNKSDSVLADVYHDIYKAAVLSKNTSDSVLNCLKTGKRIYAEDAEITYFNAEIIRLRKNFAYAIELYTEAINQSVSEVEKSLYYPEFFKNRAYSYSKLQNYIAAQKDYSEYLQYNKSDAAIYMNRAICYLNSDNKKLALEDFKKSFELGNMNAQLYIDKLSK